MNLPSSSISGADSTVNRVARDDRQRLQDVVADIFQNPEDAVEALVSTAACYGFKSAAQLLAERPADFGALASAMTVAKVELLSGALADVVATREELSELVQFRNAFSKKRMRQEERAR
jgi:hypothetical protein